MALLAAQPPPAAHPASAPRRLPSSQNLRLSGKCSIALSRSQGSTWPHAILGDEAVEGIAELHLDAAIPKPRFISLW
ncbi:hypothetical protein [Mesorhizobium sp. WSM2561]|uniref:hypothetical protein n=1 Tax=Mesorhizobium sp. WSM2561 TaxID=1040985 RepID=UPI00055B3062|nr:hypothetical protein [Mesorhizobium sp. WSM2561]